MPGVERERRSARLFWALILALLIGYAAIKARHIAVAVSAYQDQPLTVDTRGAAK